MGTGDHVHIVVDDDGDKVRIIYYLLIYCSHQGWITYSLNMVDVHGSLDWIGWFSKEASSDSRVTALKFCIIPTLHMVQVTKFYLINGW